MVSRESSSPPTIPVVSPVVTSVPSAPIIASVLSAPVVSPVAASVPSAPVVSPVIAPVLSAPVVSPVIASVLSAPVVSPVAAPVVSSLSPGATDMSAPVTRSGLPSMEELPEVVSPAAVSAPVWSGFSVPTASEDSSEPVPASEVLSSASRFLGSDADVTPLEAWVSRLAEA